jgi:hypothetical protein
MDAKQAVYAATQLIKPRYVIPFHDFLEPSMEKLLQFQPQSPESISSAKPFLEGDGESKSRI